MGVQQKMKRQGNALKTMQLAGRKNSRRCAEHRHAARRGSQSAQSKTATFDRAARQQRFGRPSDKPEQCHS
jgi:hypothetical protein